MRRHLPTWAGWGLALALAAGFAMLGIWQLGRAQHKQAMLARVQQVLRQRQAVPLSQAQDAVGYAWAEGAGRFAPAPAVLLDNQMRGGRVGVRVFRVFTPTGAPALLVDMGWLPLPPDRVLPPVPPPPAGERRVRGLLAPPPASGLRAATQPQVQRGGALLVLGVQPQALAPALGVAALAPRVLKLDPALPWGHVRDLEILPNTLPPARHVGYAVQWFGLALAVLVTAAVVGRRRRAVARAKMGG